MAEGVVGWLILKLRDALANEAVEHAYSFFGVEGCALKGLFREMRDVKRELESIQAFLRAAERFRGTDVATAAFVRQIRSLAYEIDDVIAECSFRLGEEADGMFLFKAVRRIRQIKIWYQLAERLRNTKASLRDAAERRGRYELKGFERGTLFSGSSSSKWSKDTFLGGNGQIIITSRIYKVARLAPESNIIHLQPLQERDAQYLFYKEAFWKCKDMICPQEVEHWAKLFVEKCNGLPIAIVCIGRLLSFRVTSYMEWEKVYRDIEMRLCHNPIMDMNIILQVSLEDLPHNIRNCFLYCCLYPENYVMQRKSLVRLWVAEGFVENIGQGTLEEMAEDYLTELIHRCLLVVVKRNDSGCVCEVQMHDILRVLALSKAHEKKFGSVYNPLKTDLIREARRVSTESGDIAQVAENAPHLRSLLVFQNSFTSASLRSLSSVNKLLSVLNLQDSSIKQLPKEVFDLFNLRFLGLRRTNIASLPRSIGRLKNLLVLDAWKCKIMKLPAEVTKLRKLTHLVITAKPVLSSLQFVPSVGVPAPTNICSLMSLQTLLLMEASAEVVRCIGALVELRTFRISKVQGCHFKNLFEAISNMTHLTRLGGNLKNITFLRLVGSRLDKDTFSCLKGLQWLVKLQLYDAYCGDTMLFTAESFPNLRVLKIRGGPHLKEIKIERGAMMSLVDLKLLPCPQLKMLPDGIEHLSTLEELTLDHTAEELVERVRWRKEMSISHVQRVYVGFIRNGELAFERII
ncbi:Disease resistance protein RPM1 [Panicum miliaceum]|uniref:Disease resistance protein RPM1 n=1 Tax=Panicum miliaceum TaxID=4540 RepID=A0A3L6T1C9_PANMI|nr:Disease resistance protein RPM1 [Panicum miliaceum]